jgi:hypothetical protein
MALAGRALTAQASLAQAGAALPAPSQGGHRSRGRWLLAAAVLAGAGLLILSASAGVAAPRALTVLHVLGTAVLIAGAGLYALANNKKQPATEITG